MANVFDQFDENTAGNPFDQFDAHAAQTATAAPVAAPSTFDQFKRQAGLLARIPIDAAASIPLAAMNAGVAARNMLGNAYNSAVGNPKTPDYELPSTTYNNVMDSAFGKPSTLVEKGTNILGQMVLGSKLPAPEIAAPAPSNYMPAAIAAKQAVIQSANKAGYVIPPSQANPTFMNRLLEGIGGKLKLQQEASIANQGVTQRLASNAVGEASDAPLTQSALEAIRSQAASKGYTPVRQFGQMASDPEYLSAIDSIAANSNGPAASFPGIKGNDELLNVLQALKQEKFDSKDAVDMTRFLRDKASDAFSAGQATAGRAYRAASDALEGVIERNLSNAGESGAEMLKNFRDARTLMAKTFTVGKSLADEAGTISAPKIGGELARNKRLSGDLLTIGQFARTFPKSSQVILDATPSISPLDAYGSAIAAGASHSVAPLGLPLTRVGIRNYLLSSAGQSRAIPEMFNAAPYAAAGLPGAAGIGSEAVADYLLR